MATNDDSPNKAIDKALKAMLKTVTDGGEFSPEEVTARVRVVTAAMQWEKIKYHIKDEEEFNPSNI